MCLNETYSEVLVCKLLSDMFPIKNGLKQGYSPLSLILCLLYNMPSGGFRHTRKACIEMLHMSLWFMLMMLIYWAKVYVL